VRWELGCSNKAYFGILELRGSGNSLEVFAPPRAPRVNLEGKNPVRNQPHWETVNKVPEIRGWIPKAPGI
jgi:hypothetical protein